jgi:hypothetical protein
MYEADLADLRFIMWVTGTMEPEMLGARCEHLFTLWKKLRKMSGRTPQLSDENARKQYEASISELRSNPAVSMVRNWVGLGRPEEGTLTMVEKVPVDIQRPHEHISSVSEVFKVQRRHTTKTVIRFLKETDTLMTSVLPVL